MWSFLPVELEFGDVGFCGGWKIGEPGEKPSEQGENQQKTQPTYDTRPGAPALGRIPTHWWETSILTTTPSLHAPQGN